jgi:ketosteroid isomerase-like protein
MSSSTDFFERREQKEMKRTHIGLKIAFVVFCVAAFSALSLGSRKAGAQERAGFDAFSDKVSQAQVELFRGHSEPLKALWSRASDTTVFGVLGGSGEHGWDAVARRLDWASTQYSDGSLTIQRVASYVDGNLGYVVQLEKARFKVPGHSDESRLEIRATWIFRRERDGWRIAHRHADSQLKRQGPAEGKK